MRVKASSEEEEEEDSRECVIVSVCVLFFHALVCECVNQGVREDFLSPSLSPASLLLRRRVCERERESV